MRATFPKITEKAWERIKALKPQVTPAPVDTNARHRGSVRQANPRRRRPLVLGNQSKTAAPPTQHERVFLLRCRRDKQYRAKVKQYLEGDL